MLGRRPQTCLPSDQREGVPSPFYRRIQRLTEPEIFAHGKSTPDGLRILVALKLPNALTVAYELIQGGWLA